MQAGPLPRMRGRARGSTHVVFDPLTLIERLAALVPRPRIHLTTYHSGAPAEHARPGACNGRRKLLAFITDSKVVRRILEHLGLTPDPPRMAPARSPPELALPFA